MFIFKIISRKYKLNVLYKTNAKRKKKKEDFLGLDIYRNSNVKSNTINAIFDNENETNLIVDKLKIDNRNKYNIRRILMKF